MFTGIVEEVGTIKNIKRGQHSAVLTIQAKTVLEGTRIGDSIAVNGICLTVTRLFPDGFSADVMHETLNRSSLAGLTAGSVVNLERAMPANGRFGGHIVAGHVDGVGHISDIRRDDTAVWYTVHAGPEILRYVVEKGSIAIDGQDLGHNEAHLRWFILDDGCRGSGVGRQLLREAVHFCDQSGFAATQLWTFKGLDAARRLYEAHGFELAKEEPGNQWGSDVTEQQFTRPLHRVTAQAVVPRGG